MPSMLAQLLCTFALTVLLVAWLRQAAVPLGLLDAPDARKQHDGKVPLCGGIAMFLTWGAVGYGWSTHFPIPAGLLLGLGLLVLVGIADDKWRLPPWPRLVMETLAAVVLIATANISTINLGLGPGFEPAGLGYAATLAVLVVFAVGTMNAMNMMDGIDGVAGASASGALFWLALMASYAGRPDLALHILLLLAATIGFLVFNMRYRWRAKAAVFLGEAGSVTLGGALAYFVITLAGGQGGLPLTALLWVLVVPVLDMASLVARRIHARRNPLSPDRWHMHHLLLQMGFSPAAAAGLIATASGLCGTIAYLGIVLDIPGPLMIAGLVVPVLVHTAVVRSATRTTQVKAEARTWNVNRLASVDGRPSGGSA